MTNQQNNMPEIKIYIRAKYYLPQIGYVYCNAQGQILEDQTKPSDGIINDNVTNQEIMYDVRTYRNSLLSDCDWTQLPDVPLTAQQVSAWRVYRQNLRDFTEQIDVENWTSPDWPTPPS